MGFALRLWSKNEHNNNMHYLTLNGIPVELLQNTCHNSGIISCIEYLLLEVENISFQEGKWFNLDSQVFN